MLDSESVPTYILINLHPYKIVFHPIVRDPGPLFLTLSHFVPSGDILNCIINPLQQT